MVSDGNLDIANSGENNGLIVGNNTGNITFLMNDSHKVPSMISTIVKALGMSCLDDESPDSLVDLKIYKPLDKLDYNCVIKYKYIIQEYSTYYMYCDNTLNLYDNSNYGCKAKILKCVNMWYLKAKGDLLFQLKDGKESDIDKIRENSDYLIDEVKAKMENIIEKSNMEIGFLEDIELGLACFICYCFMECKILEKPL